MRTSQNTLQHHVIIGERVVNQFFSQLPPSVQLYWEGLVGLIIKTRGITNTKMKWNVYNIRYGVQRSISGGVGEMITVAAIKRLHPTSDPYIVTDKETQTKGIDIIDLESNQSYQVKTIRILDDNTFTLNRKSTELISPTATFTVLVDIDCSTVFMVDSVELSEYLAPREEYSFSGPQHGGDHIGWSNSVDDLLAMSIWDNDAPPLYTKPSIRITEEEELAI